MTARTRGGLTKFRPVRPGAAIAIVAPASPFKWEQFDAGVAELKRLGFAAVFESSVFERGDIVAGPADVRARALVEAVTRDDVDALIAVRGGYGSAEVLPLLDARTFRESPKAFVGYSDLTSLHAWLNGHVGITSVHGAMLEGRLAVGEAEYDRASLLGSLSTEPLGELTGPTLEVIRPGAASGPLVGGTLTQLVATLGTPYCFVPPRGAVLFIEDVAERPFRIRRMLTQLRQSGRLAHLSAIVCGQMSRCDEPGGRVTARAVIAEFFADFPGPVLFGFSSGHTTTPMVSLPFGVETRVLGESQPRLIVEEAAAG
ncbi:MAG: LD-carboxypeptidase [Acidobacteriota bacterium]